MTEKEKHVYRRQCEEDAENHKSQNISQNWAKYYQFYIGKHWDAKSDPTGNYPVTNYCFSSIRTTVALLTDNKPRLSCLPVDKEDIVGADIMRKILWAIWDKQICDQKLPLVLTDNHIFGTGFWKIYYNKAQDDIAIDVIPPEYFYVSPDATTLQNATYFFQKQPMTLSQIRRAFPETGKKIKPNQSLTPSNVLRRLNLSPSTETHTFQSGTSGAKASEYPLTETERMLAEGQGWAYVTEFWCWDLEEDDYRVTTYSDDIILSEKWAQDLSGKKGVPLFVPFYNYWDSNLFWGREEIANIAGLNRDYNILTKIIMDNIDQMGNQMFIMDSNAGVEIDKLTNQSGLIVTKNPGTEFRRDAPDAMPSDVFRLRADVKFDIDNQTGIQDVTQGKRPVGLTAGIAISELQEAAQVPIRYKGRMMQVALNHVGKIVTLLVKKNYTKKRMLAVKRGMTPEHFEFDPDNLKGEYDLYFDVESGLGATRASRLNQAIQLKSLGVYDNRAVLEMLDDPQREEVLKREALRDAINKLMSNPQAMAELGVGGNIPQELMGAMGGMLPKGGGVKELSNTPMPLADEVEAQMPIGG